MRLKFKTMRETILIKFLRVPLLLFAIAIIMINSGNNGVLATGYQTSDQSSKGGGGYANNNDDSGSPANYMFEYGIDDHYGPMLSHMEERNDQTTRGRYSVLLPDGRLQVVTYWADKNGYNADVTYQPSSSGGYGGGGAGRGGSRGNEGGYGGGGISGGYENVQALASSYSQQPSPPTPKSNDGAYSGKASATGNKGHGSLSSKSNSRTFVKFRRTDNGRSFNYAY